jgi:hypothetical protein
LVKLFDETSTMIKRMHTEDAQRDGEADSHPFAAWLADAEPASQPPWSHVTTHAPPHRDETVTTTVEGVVRRVDRDSLWLHGHAAGHTEASFDTCVSHQLPRAVDLRPLIGKSVRATMVYEEASGAGTAPGRTLTIIEDDGRVWLIARSGTVAGIARVTHAVSTHSDAPQIHAALSQRPLGPLVVGTEDLQHLVPVGESAPLHLADGALFHALLVERHRDGSASYVLADDALMRSPAAS